MGLREDVADAGARRAHLIDKYSMQDAEAECMACRARGIMLALGLVVLGGWALVVKQGKP